MNCLIPIKNISKVQTTKTTPDGKTETKIQSKEQTLYSHSSWLEEENEQKIIEIFKQQTYRTRFTGVATGILSFITFKNVPFLSKLRWEYKLGGVLAPAILAYAAAGFILGKADQIKINKIIQEKDNIPVWKNKERVIQKKNVYFFLDDDNGFNYNILYHGITQKQIDNILPDSVFGNDAFQDKFYKNFVGLINNNDASQTNHLLQQLSYHTRAKRDAANHH